MYGNCTLSNLQYVKFASALLVTIVHLHHKVENLGVVRLAIAADGSLGIADA